MIFSAVGGQQDYSTISQCLWRNPLNAAFPELGEGSLQRIHHWVAGDEDSLGRDSFAQQILSGSRRGREMQRGDHAGKAPVHFLRIGMGKIIRAQSRLYMADRNFQVEGSQTG